MTNTYWIFRRLCVSLDQDLPMSISIPTQEFPTPDGKKRGKGPSKAKAKKAGVLKVPKPEPIIDVFPSG